MSVYIQVFVSSTFSDFSAEREHLSRALPAALRSRFKGRNVDISLLDLRWGLTEEQVRDVGIVSACLAAVERCTPFFVGLIGDRYGTVPTFLPEDVNRHPWLLAHEGKSITELEIIHGVLNAGNRRAIFVSRTSCSSDLDPRVQNLLATIEASGAPILKSPATVDDTLAFIERHLSDQIEAILPEDLEESLAVLRGVHGTKFWGRDPAASALADKLDGSSRVVWITGGAGAGKSAILTEASSRASAFSQQLLATVLFSDEKDDGNIEEALAKTCDALGQVNDRYAFQPLNARNFFAYLNKAAVLAADQGRNICIVWDNAPADWIARHTQEFRSLPNNIRLIATSRAPAPDGLPDVCTFIVPEPSFEEINAYVFGRLKALGRNLPSEIHQRFLEAPQSRNYHFTAIALDELLHGSSHASLGRDTVILTNADGLGGLIDIIALRMDAHFGGNLASSALLTVYCFEKPISNALLQSVLQIDNLSFASLLLSLSGPLATGYNGLTLRSSYRIAIAQSALLRKQGEEDARMWLASRLLSPPACPSAAEEQVVSPNVGSRP